MKFIPGLVICLFALMSCSTPHDLKKTEPIVSYSTEKSAEDVKKCIFKKWKAHLTLIEEQKTEQGWMIRHNDTIPAVTIAIATIEGESPDVKVRYFDRSQKFRDHRLEDEVLACK